MLEFLFPTTYAAGPILDPSASYSASELIQTGVALIVIVGGLCSVLFIIWGGLMLILSGGKDEKVKPAINSIRYAVIGIIVIVIAIFIAPQFMRLLGIGNYEYLSPANIFSTVKRLMLQVFGGSSDPYYTPSSTTIADGFSDL